MTKLTVKHIFGKLRLKFKRFMRDSILPKGLWARSLLMIVMPVVLLQLVVAILFYEQHWKIISNRMASGLVGDISYVLSLMDKNPKDEWQDIFNDAQRNLKIGFFMLDKDKMPKGVNVNVVSDEIAVEELSRVVAKTLPYNFIITEGAQRKTVNVYLQMPEGVLEIIVPTRRFFSSTAYVFPAWMFGSAVLLFGIAWLFMRIQVRSIRRLSKAADRFGKGQDMPNFKPEGASEVRQAAVAFINMRDRIKRQLDERTTMLAGVSHDLRTPLTRMKLQLAMMKKSEEIELLRSDVKDMEVMLEGYLSFARGEGKEAFQKVEVSALVKELVKKMRRSMAKIDLHIEQPMEMMVRPNDFSRAIANVLSNAARYASQAAVTIGTHGGALEIIIDDNGKGIPENLRAQVFKAFYRIEESRNKQTGGVGLGLTITRDIVTAHGGEIYLESSPLGGLRVRLKFPL